MTTTSTPRSTLSPSGLTLGVDTSTAVCVGLARGVVSGEHAEESQIDALPTWSHRGEVDDSGVILGIGSTVDLDAQV